MIYFDPPKILLCPLYTQYLILLTTFVDIHIYYSFIFLFLFFWRRKTEDKSTWIIYSGLHSKWQSLDSSQDLLDSKSHDLSIPPRHYYFVVCYLFSIVFHILLHNDMAIELSKQEEIKMKLSKILKQDKWVTRLISRQIRGVYFRYCTRLKASKFLVHWYGSEYISSCEF